MGRTLSGATLLNQGTKSVTIITFSCRSRVSAFEDIEDNGIMSQTRIVGALSHKKFQFFSVIFPLA